MAWFEVRIEAVLDEFSDWLRKYQDLTGKTWPQILRKQCRLLSIELARRTQPFGWGEDAQAAGEGAVSRDISKASLSSGQVFDSLKAGDKKKAGLFYQAYKAGKYRKAEKILEKADGSQYKGYRFGKFTPQEHVMRRNKRGRVTGGRPQFITRDQDVVDKYKKKVKKSVGWAKAAWVNCARKLGGTRGSASWAWKGKQASPGFVDDKSTRDKNPGILLRNDVPYIENLLPEREQNEALKQTQGGIILETKAALAAIARKTIKRK